MARGRMLSKTLSVSQRFNSIEPAGDIPAEFAQLLFTLLLPHTDDFGRMSGDPFSVKMTALPASLRPIEQFTAALKMLHAAKLIDLYEVDAAIFLQISKFEEHQSGLHKRTASKIPAPSGKFPEIPGNSRSRARAELNRTELKGRERTSTTDVPNLRQGDSSESPQNPLAPPQKSHSNGTPANVTMDEALAARVGAFVERYPTIYAKVRNGARYLVKQSRDFDAFVQLVNNFGAPPNDARLDVLLEVFLKMPEKRANNIPGTPNQFLNMVPECDRLLREHGR